RTYGKEKAVTLGRDNDVARPMSLRWEVGDDDFGIGAGRPVTLGVRISNNLDSSGDINEFGRVHRVKGDTERAIQPLGKDFGLGRSARIGSENKNLPGSAVRDKDIPVWRDADDAWLCQPLRKHFDIE